MSEIVIGLNNDGVLHMHLGNVFNAFELLTRAFDTLIELGDLSNRRSVFVYRWVDCGDVSGSLKVPGCACFLTLRLLAVNMLENHEGVDGGNAETHQDGLAFVVWYNFGTLTALSGIQLGDRGQDIQLRSKWLFDLVVARLSQNRPVIESHPPFTVMPYLQLGLWNNLICVLESLGFQELKIQCIMSLGSQLYRTGLSPSVSITDWKQFFLTYYSLSRSHWIAVAA